MAMKVASKIVDALLESDEVDPKAFAQSRDQQIGEYKPILVHGSYGTLKVDPYDGTVLRYDDAPVDGTAAYSDVVKFDLEELRRWLRQNTPKFADIVQPGAEFDIVNVSFWTDSGDYVPGEPDHRAITYGDAEPG
jgi:hypothetical protein